MRRCSEFMEVLLSSTEAAAGGEGPPGGCRADVHGLHAAAGGEGLEACGRGMHDLKAPADSSPDGEGLPPYLDQQRGNGAAPEAVHGGTKLGDGTDLDAGEAEGDPVLLCPLLLEAVVQQQYMAVSERRLHSGGSTRLWSLHRPHISAAERTQTGADSCPFSPPAGG